MRYLNFALGRVTLATWLVVLSSSSLATDRTSDNPSMSTSTVTAHEAPSPPRGRRRGDKATGGYLKIDTTGTLNNNIDASCLRFQVRAKEDGVLTFKLARDPARDAWKTRIRFVSGDKVLKVGGIAEKDGELLGTGRSTCSKGSNGWWNISICLSDHVNATEVTAIDFGRAGGGISEYFVDDIYLDGTKLWAEPGDPLNDGKGVATAIRVADRMVEAQWPAKIAAGRLASDHYPTTHVPSRYSNRVFEDHFSTFDESKWNRGISNKETGSSHLVNKRRGGGPNILNQENYAGYITDEDSFVQDGVLFLQNQRRRYRGTEPPPWEWDVKAMGWRRTPRPADFPVGRTHFDYTSGWINSFDKFGFNGTEAPTYLEVRAKFPRGKNVWPAIWMVGVKTWPPEIDVWEYFGWHWDDTHQDYMAMRYIYPTQWPRTWLKTGNTSHLSQGFVERHNADTVWHTYGFEWAGDVMVWYLNGKEIHRKHRYGADRYDMPAEHARKSWPDEVLYLTLNNGVLAQTDPGSPFNPNDKHPAVFPNYLSIDYLAVYQDSATLDAGNTASSRD